MSIKNKAPTKQECQCLSNTWYKELPLEPTKIATIQPRLKTLKTKPPKTKQPHPQNLNSFVLLPFKQCTDDTLNSLEWYKTKYLNAGEYQC